jgi:hypothetical protein
MCKLLSIVSQRQRWIYQQLPVIISIKNTYLKNFLKHACIASTCCLGALIFYLPFSVVHKDPFVPVSCISGIM